MSIVIFARRATFFGILIAASSSYAQTYRCSSGGSTYLSDRPCGDQNRTQIGVYGPARSSAATPYSSQLPGAPKVQEHVKYLPSGCASIVEAIRTGPARGVRGDVIRSLQDEYNQKCSLEDQDARNQLRQEKSQQKQLKLAERDEATKGRQQSKLRADQCGSMREVIALKRKRESELNSMEVGALRDLEKTYNERCIAS